MLVTAEDTFQLWKGDKMAKQYWVKCEGKTTGPFLGQQLRQMVAADMITASDLISVDEINWQVAGQVKGLFQVEQLSGKGDTAFTESPSVEDSPVFGDSNWIEQADLVTAHGPKGSVAPTRQTQNVVKKPPQKPAESNAQVRVVSDAAPTVPIPGKRPLRVLILAVVNLILGIPVAVVMLMLVLVGGWPHLLGVLAMLSLVASGIYCLRRDEDSRRRGYWTGMAYAVLSIILFLVEVILLASTWPFLGEMQGPMLNMTAMGTLIYLPYPIITIIVLNSRSARRCLLGTKTPREQTGFAATSPIIASLLIAPLAAYFTYVSYDWIVYGKTALATITEVRRTPADNIIPISSKRVHANSVRGFSVTLHYEYTVGFDGHTATLDQFYTVDGKPWVPFQLPPMLRRGNGAIGRDAPAVGRSDEDLTEGLRLAFSEPQGRPVVGEQLIVAYLTHSPTTVKDRSKAYVTLWRLLVAVAFDVMFVTLLYRFGRRIRQNP